VKKATVVIMPNRKEIEWCQLLVSARHPIATLNWATLLRRLLSLFSALSSSSCSLEPSPLAPMARPAELRVIQLDLVGCSAARLRCLACRETVHERREQAEKVLPAWTLGQKWPLWSAFVLFCSFFQLFSSFFAAFHSEKSKRRAKNNNTELCGREERVLQLASRRWPLTVSGWPLEVSLSRAGPMNLFTRSPQTETLTGQHLLAS